MLVEKIVDSLLESPYDLDPSMKSYESFRDMRPLPVRSVTRYYETGENVGMWEKWFTENNIDREAFMKLARNEEEGFPGVEELYVETKDPVLYAMSDFSQEFAQMFVYGSEQLEAYAKHMTDQTIRAAWKWAFGEDAFIEPDMHEIRAYVNGNYPNSKRIAKLLNLYNPDAYEVSDEEIDAVELD